MTLVHWKRMIQEEKSLENTHKKGWDGRVVDYSFNFSVNLTISEKLHL